MSNLRIGVYSIALNEEQFAERWAKSAADADHIFVADTGSTDNTVSILETNNVKVTPISIRPWRFDDARNTALHLMPADLDAVIALDIDEVLVPGWREKFEQAWSQNCTRLRYKYIWSWYHGEPDVVYYGDKIAGRHTHRWKHPVHEVLVPTVPEVVEFCNDQLIEHHPDHSKSRSQYLGLLEKAVEEDPADDRNAYYLGREYYFVRRYQDSISQLKRHLDLPKAVWDAERAASMRHIGKSYEAIGDVRNADYWFTAATFEDPDSREALIDAARFCLAQNYFHRTIDYCDRASNLRGSGGNYLNERYALLEGAYDLAAVAYFHLGNKAKAVEFAEKAVELNPHDPRLQTNLAMMKS